MRAPLRCLILGVLGTACAQSDLDTDVMTSGSAVGGAAGAAASGGDTGGWTTGGASTGGVATGGVATGGASTGGVATGGVATGGVATGGVATGGVTTGGVSAGGASTGGTGGAGTGGVTTGGASTGGSSTGGIATGGAGTGGLETGGAETGGDGTGGGGTVDCDEATATDLGPYNTGKAVPSDACVKIAVFESWWDTRPAVLQTGATGTYPVPFVWETPCAGASGSGTFTKSWDQVPISATSEDCATLIELGGDGSSTLTLIWQSG